MRVPVTLFRNLVLSSLLLAGLIALGCSPASKLAAPRGASVRLSLHVPSPSHTGTAATPAVAQAVSVDQITVWVWGYDAKLDSILTDTLFTPTLRKVFTVAPGATQAELQLELPPGDGFLVLAGLYGRTQRTGATSPSTSGLLYLGGTDFLLSEVGGGSVNIALDDVVPVPTVTRLTSGDQIQWSLNDWADSYSVEDGNGVVVADQTTSNQYLESVEASGFGTQYRVRSEMPGAGFVLGLAPYTAWSEPKGVPSPPWTESAPLSVARAWGGAAGSNGTLYFAGGTTGSTHYNTCDSFYPGYNTWSGVGTGPVPLAKFGCAIFGGYGYIVGGEPASGVDTNLVLRYDMTTGAYSVRQAVPMRAGYSCAVVNGLLYAVTRDSAATVYRYDPTADAWTLLPTPPARVFNTCAATVNGVLYLVGGTDTYGSVAYGYVQAYVPSTNAWHVATVMPTVRGYVVAAGLNGVLYAIGGASPTYPSGTNVVEAFDPVGGTWTTKTPMPSTRWGCAGDVVGSSICVVGGLASGAPSGRVETYTPSVDFSPRSAPARVAQAQPGRSLSVRPPSAGPTRGVFANPRMSHLLDALRSARKRAGQSASR